MHVVLLGRLRGEHEGLREAAHGRAAVGQLARHLHHHAVAQRGLRVHLTHTDQLVTAYVNTPICYLVDLPRSSPNLVPSTGNR